jgi:uncharacterized membrane protein YgdD (TMEM256/DUF423 family)
MMIERVWLGIAGLSGALAVAAEAAARHVTGDPHRLDLAATAGRYGLTHALALLAVAIFAFDWREGRGRLWLMASGWAFAGGLLLFSGSLYLLAAGAPQMLAGLTPIGGLLFIAGWTALLVTALVARWPGGA